MGICINRRCRAEIPAYAPRVVPQSDFDNGDAAIARAMAHKTGLLKAKKQPEEITVGKALERYIKNYKGQSISGFAGKKISSLNKSIVQCAVNADKCSAKTLQNSYSLIASAIAEAGGKYTR